jgi:hypothetical protein
MSAEEDGCEELKQFADDLAALVPRADRLDPRFATLLEKEAALTAELAATHAAQPGRPTACPYCGRSGPGDRAQFRSAAVSAAPGGQDARAPGRRWAWPAAFSAMSTVAAALLVMLLIRPQPQVVERTSQPPKTVPAASAMVETTGARRGAAEPAEQEPALSTQRQQWSASGWMAPAGEPAWDQFARLRWRHQRPGNLAAADAELLDHLLAASSEVRAPPAAASVAFNDSRKSPPSYRELLEQMLREQ